MEGPSSEDDVDGAQVTADCESALKHRGDLELDGVVEAEDMVVVVVVVMGGEEVETVVVPRVRLGLVLCLWEDVELDTDVMVSLSRRDMV